MVKMNAPAYYVLKVVRYELYIYNWDRYHHHIAHGHVSGELAEKLLVLLWVLLLAVFLFQGTRLHKQKQPLAEFYSCNQILFWLALPKRHNYCSSPS